MGTRKRKKPSKNTSTGVKAVRAFMKSYAKEFDYYAALAKACASTCELSLEQAGIRAIVTWRAKKPKKLEAKLLERNREKKYSGVEHIQKDIVDLAGVRIALYFPGERSRVEHIIHQSFEVEATKPFPLKKQKHPPGYTKRFSGYSAVHFRVGLKKPNNDHSDARFLDGRVEIQIASVLMHAWAEVEHDLVYKPMSGRLSVEENQTLDEINGLVIAGELALERLQDAQKRRVSKDSRSFQDKYDLSAYIYGVLKEKIPQNKDVLIDDVNVLLRFLQLAKWDNVAALEKHLAQFDPKSKNKEIIPQLIETILAKNPSLYELYNRAVVETKGRKVRKGRKAPKRDALRDFLAHWIAFEFVAREISGPNSRSVFSPFFGIEKTKTLSNEELHDVYRIRRLRNSLVHGLEMPQTKQLESATAILKKLLHKMLAKAPLHTRIRASKIIATIGFKVKGKKM